MTKNNSESLLSGAITRRALNRHYEEIEVVRDVLLDPDLVWRIKRILTLAYCMPCERIDSKISLMEIEMRPRSGPYSFHEELVLLDKLGVVTIDWNRFAKDHREPHLRPLYIDFDGGKISKLIDTLTGKNARIHRKVLRNIAKLMAAAISLNEWETLLSDSRFPMSLSEAEYPPTLAGKIAYLLVALNSTDDENDQKSFRWLLTESVDSLRHDGKVARARTLEKNMNRFLELVGLSIKDGVVKEMPKGMFYEGYDKTTGILKLGQFKIRVSKQADKDARRLMATLDKDPHVELGRGEILSDWGAPKDAPINKIYHAARAVNAAVKKVARIKDFLTYATTGAHINGKYLKEE